MKGQRIRELTEEGQQAAQEARIRAQIRQGFLADHDQDFMQGILDVPPGATDAEIDQAIDWWFRNGLDGGGLDVAVAARLPQ